MFPAKSPLQHDAELTARRKNRHPAAFAAAVRASRNALVVSAAGVTTTATTASATAHGMSG
jgi:hypothetical protein